MRSEEKLRNMLIACSPTASITIGGVVANCILDTGAETSLICSSFYDSQLAGKTNCLGTVGTFIRLFGANDLEIPVRGYLETFIEVFGVKVKAIFSGQIQPRWRVGKREAEGVSHYPRMQHITNLVSAGC